MAYIGTGVLTKHRPTKPGHSDTGLGLRNKINDRVRVRN